ncbi:hypothetical protein FACS189419_06950 [Planctomycetales bacterium]|nr:hypothetical protein FACS189419_06950 [Planctomycetales bacterium]
MSDAANHNESITSINHNIEAALTLRHKFAEEPAEKIHLLQVLEEKLKVFKNGTLRQYINNADNDKKDALAKLEDEIKSFIDDGKISELRKKLKEILNRFKRDTLCVGIVGNKGQGKSKFLQGITGLNDDVIPTGTGKDTTGAQMVFTNDFNTSEVKATLELYTGDEFLKKVIQPLYSKVDLLLPNNLTDFAEPTDTAKRDLQAKKEQNPELVATIERLQKGYPAYKNYLKGGNEDIPRSEIRNWTAKHDEANNPLTKWMAVKLAKIQCRFPKLDGVKISVADTPGLGDSYAINEGENLQENFTANVDEVCFFRRINQKGLGTQDKNLYDIVAKAIPELNVERWTHFVVNVFDSERNDSTAQGFLQTLRDCFDDPSNSFHKLQNRFIEVSVCTGEPPVLNTEDVLKVFSKIVADLSENQLELDKELFTERFKMVSKIKEDILQLVGKIKKLSPKDDASLPLTELHKLVTPCLKNVENALQQLVHQKRNIREQPDTELSELIETAKETAITNAKQILGEDEHINGDSHIFALDTLHKLRVALSTAFDDLDINLETNLKEMRKQVADIFQSQGKLGGLFPLDDNAVKPITADEYLLQLAERWEDIDGGQVMSKVIREFVKMTFSFRAYLLPKVRGTLDAIDYDSGEAPSIESGSTWEQNKKAFEQAFNAAANACADELKELTSETNMAVFAIIDQFRDGILHTGGYLSCREKWEAFYDENKDKIWAERFDKIKDNRILKRNWERELDDVQDAVSALQ